MQRCSRIDYADTLTNGLTAVMVYGGTSEIMKTIIAREVTGLRA